MRELTTGPFAALSTAMVKSVQYLFGGPLLSAAKRLAVEAAVATS